jgi:pyruvate,water dikinase
MSYLLLFREIKPINLEIVGVKASGLSLFYQRQSIPPGFVLTTLAYQYFIEAAGIKAKINELISFLNDSNIQEIANSIQKMIVNADFPKDLSASITENYLALSIDKKLSAQEIINADNEAASVGLRVSHDENNSNLEHISMLNIKGETRLLAAIKILFASEYTLRNIHMRKVNNLPAEPKIAVIIQKMINPEKSVLICIKNNSAKLKAVFGAGKGLKDKELFPDEYEVGKENLAIKDVHIKNQTYKYQFSTANSTIDKVSLGEIGRLQKLSKTEIIMASKIGFDVGEDKMIEIAIVGQEYYVISINRHSAAGKENASTLEVYDLLPQKTGEVQDEGDNANIEFMPKKEIRPIMEKIDDGVINYDEEDDLKDEFEKDDYRIYEDDYATDKKHKS